MSTNDLEVETSSAPVADSRSATAGKPRERASKRTVRSVPALDLVPDLSAREAAGVETSALYWVGVTPDCPVDCIMVAGVSFPKLNELLVPDPMRTGQKRRVPVIGGLVRLSGDQIAKVTERMRRTVVRFIDNQGTKDEPSAGQNIGDVHVRPSKGHLITIPTEEEIEARRSRNRSVRLYSPSANDKPAANYMFARLCKDQKAGERGDYYPEPLSKTGFDLPES